MEGCIMLARSNPVKAIETSTTLSIALVISLLSLAFTCGIGWNKLTNLEEKSNGIRTDHSKIESAVVNLARLVETHDIKIQNLEKMSQKN
jgi:hypothetical protein